MDSEKVDLPFYVRLSRSMRDKVDADAKAKGQTLAEWTRRAFEVALHGAEKDAAP